MPRVKKKKPEPKADFKLPGNLYQHVNKALKANRWGDDVEVLEHADYLLFPSTIYKRKTDGTFDEIEVRIRVPREHEMRKARKQARDIMEKDGLDWKDADADLFTNIETWCTLAMAVRSTTDPYEPHDPDPRSLEQRYDKNSLMAVWSQLNAFSRLIDPRPDEISAPEVLGMIVAIARDGHTGPLAVYDTPAQSSFIVTMAKLCAISVASKSFLEQLKALKEELSPPPPSSTH